MKKIMIRNKRKLSEFIILNVSIQLDENENN